MKRSKLLVLISVPILMLVVILALLFYFGLLLFNNPSVEEYPVRGVDVSSYQGEIDWEILSEQDIHFAFIKATEGSGYTDPYFSANYRGAQETDLRIGAYHFFSFDSSGKTQAENFIAAVPAADDMLPPVVDFEFYGEKEKNPPDACEARAALDAMLQALEAYYGMKPIIYATEKPYDVYLSGHYDEYDIWIRNVLTVPKPLNDQAWTFWQYTNRARLEGYHGKEYYIDMNVFNGTMEAFNAYPADHSSIKIE